MSTHASKNIPHTQQGKQPRKQTAPRQTKPQSGKQALTLRHVLVVVAGICMLLGPCALVYNTWSIFVVPVSTSLGVSSSQFTFYITIVYLCSAVAAPFVGNLLERYDLRIVLSVSVILVAVGIVLCSFWTEVWQFYISGVIEGLGIVALMFLAIPTIINRWFSSHTGFLIGLCMAMSGVGGALWSMVGGLVISGVGWRSAYLLYAVLVLVLALPATLFFVRSYPHDVGMKPYGAPQQADEGMPAAPAHNMVDNEEPSSFDTAACPSVSTNAAPERSDNQREWGVPAHVMFKSPVFYALMIAIGLFNMLTAVGNLFATYIYHLGNTGAAGITPDSAVMMASTVAACLMIVAAIGKVVLGACSDKSPFFAVALTCALGVVSIVCMWQGSKFAVAVYAGAILYGFVYAAVDALGPSITRQIVGPREYTLIYSRIAIFVNIAGACAVTAFSLIAEISWEAEWIATLSVLAIIFILFVYVFKRRSTLKQTYEEKPFTS